MDNSNQRSDSDHHKDPSSCNDSHINIFKQESSSGPSIIKIKNQHESPPAAKLRRVTTAAKKTNNKAAEIKAEDEVDTALDERNSPPSLSNDEIVALEAERSQLMLSWVDAAIQSAIDEAKGENGEVKAKDGKVQEKGGSAKEKSIQPKEYATSFLFVKHILTNIRNTSQSTPTSKDFPWPKTLFTTPYLNKSTSAIPPTRRKQTHLNDVPATFDLLSFFKGQRR